MNNSLPKYTKNRQIAERGLTFVKKIVEDEFGWIFRKITLDDDFGLDGYIDIIKDGEYVTGKYFGVQIKTGESYFATDKGFGWEFKGESKHLNYYLNCQFPILIILVDLEKQQAFWTEFKIENIFQSGINWKTDIFKRQEFKKDNKEQLQKIAGDVIDYLPQLQYQWLLNKELLESGLVVMAVDRSEIETLNVSGFEVLLKKLLSSHELVLGLKGKLTFLIFGYDKDKRELYQIPEVRDWVQKVIPIFKYWGYFLNMEDNLKSMAGLSVLHLCSINPKAMVYSKEKNMYNIELDSRESAMFIEPIFMWLNEICEEYKISENVIYEQSKRITQLVMNLDDDQIKTIYKT